MTDIKSAIEVVNKYLIRNMRDRNFVSEEQIELENSLVFLRDYVEKTSKAWEEVLTELEEQLHIGKDSNWKNATINAICIINQHLAEIEKVR